MSDDLARWQRLQNLFDQALALDAEARRQFAAHACDDEEMRRDLEALVDADQNADQFLAEPLIRRHDEETADGRLAGDHPAGDPLSSEDTRDSGPGEARAGDRFGPYRVLRVLGSGGMSTVYLAVRDDDTFQRRVVVKLVRADRQDADLDRRLRTERSILAGLDHPNIARLFDGGTTPDGRPYFVLELVEGLPITDFADQRQLSIDERLTLFRKVLDAVQYAHQNLVIHRDLKPSNILVTAAGEPKLLDFGIAKLINPDLAAVDLQATATWMRLMTPHFASPEQVRGKLVGTTSDIYSLGVLLYQLLTGRLPFDFEGRSAGEIERILTETDPDVPSAALSSLGDEDTTLRIDVARARCLDPRALEQHLTGDLDAIVMKALRSAPQRRYPSAERFADDLRRFQTGMPIDARQGNWRYRLGKLVRRNRTATAVTLALAIALALGALGLGVQHAQVVRQRDAAESERQQRETVLALLLDVLGVADPFVAAGNEFSVREALESSAPKLRRQLADQPALRAELLHTTGTIYHNLGLWSRAKSDFEEAIALRRGLFGPDAPSVAVSEGQLAIVLAQIGAIDEARSLAAHAVDSQRATDRTENVLDALNVQVTVLCTARDYEAAATPSAAALELARTIGSTAPLATALVNRAHVLLRQKSHAEAAELFRQGIELLTLKHGEGHPMLAKPLSNLGSARRRAGDIEGAQSAFEQALAIQQSSLGDAHPAMAATLNNLASIDAHEGRYETAIDRFERASRVLEAQAGEDNRQVFFLAVQIANTRFDAGAPEIAVSKLEALLPSWRARLAADDPYLTRAEALLAKARTEVDRTPNQAGR